MKAVIIGAGGHGKVVLDALRQAGRVDVIGFIDADAAKVGSVVMGLSVIGGINQLSKLRRQDVKGAIVAIGDSRVRRSYADLVTQSGLELINALHPSAVISPAAKLGRNILVAPNAVIGPETEVGDSVIVNTGALVDHECRLGVACHVCPGAVLAGRVTVAEGAFVGMGSRTLPCITIGPNAVVGAGAVVTADVPPDATVVGVPARIIKRAGSPA